VWERSAPGTPGEHVVLYIEDNLPNLRLVERVLARRPGVVLLSAMQGTLGVELAHQHRPDLVLLDLNLPDRPGIEVLAALRSDPATAEVPVVIVSADATPGQLERLMRAGASEYLTKPFDVARFLEVVDAALDRAGGDGRGGALDRPAALVADLTGPAGGAAAAGGGSGGVLLADLTRRDDPHAAGTEPAPGELAAPPADAGAPSRERGRG
jgi:CheY-like chemotaxis protein